MLKEKCFCLFGKNVIWIIVVGSVNGGIDRYVMSDVYNCLIGIRF